MKEYSPVKVSNLSSKDKTEEIAESEEQTLEIEKEEDYSKQSFEDIRYLLRLFNESLPLKIKRILSFIIIVAVIFAYLTNKKYVFNTSPSTMADYINEFFKFLLCRILTGVLDIVIMLLAVDYMNLNAVIWKLLSNIIVTVINYFASKNLIFSKK